MRARTDMKEARLRRDAWKRLRGQSGLKTREVAALLGRSIETVRSYGKANGNVPTADAIDALKAHNHTLAFTAIKEKFGPRALVRFEEGEVR